MAKIDGVQEVALEALKPYEKNAKIHNAEQVDRIAKSIQEFGFISPCLIDKDFNIIAGHGRVKAAQQLNLKTVPCVFIEGLTETQRKAYILADNRLTELGEWDEALISDELTTLKNEGFDLNITGFDVDDILFEELDDTYEEERGLEPPQINTVKRGNVYQLGRHRLMCGDSTRSEDVERLMNGEKADLLETDPPYGVDYSSKNEYLNKADKGNHIQADIENDALGTGFKDFLFNVFQNAYNHMKKGAVFYCWYATINQKIFQEALEDADLAPKETLIWVKNILVLGRQDYQWRHEPCFYGWKQGARHYFIDMRSLTTVTEADLETKTKSELISMLNNILDDRGTVIHENKPTSSNLHPTMKPLGLIKKHIRNSTREGELVIDLFGGSGTTLMACEEMNRRCFTMEYDPRYCDVIIQRWETLTGKKAVLINEAV